MEFMKVLLRFIFLCFLMVVLNYIVMPCFATGIAIGGDVFPGSTLSDHVLRFNNIPQVEFHFYLQLIKNCQRFGVYHFLVNDHSVFVLNLRLK